MELEDNKRRRRISESEEAALLAVASPHLRSMIIAALDTGMRRGEMLALRFGDIDWTRRMITLRGATTKSRRTRLVPIAARLLAVLGWLRLDGEGEHKGDGVAVFSNEAGEALKTFKKAWVVAVLRAHGHRPSLAQGRLQGPLNGLSAAVSGHQPALARPEARCASRLVERGVPLAQVRDLLGHASILTTERYDNQRLEALQAAVERLEGGQDVRPEARCFGQSFKNLSRSHRTELRSKRRPRQGIRYKSLIACSLEGWVRAGIRTPVPWLRNAFPSAPDLLRRGRLSELESRHHDLELIGLQIRRSRDSADSRPRLA